MKKIRILSYKRHLLRIEIRWQRVLLIECHDLVNYKYIIISQPHGGRRHIKYTAFLFSSDQTEYVFHSDSDTLVDKYALINMAQTAAGYNA